MPSVVTANDLRSGLVVYLTSDGQWAQSVGDAGVAADTPTLERLQALALASVVKSEVTAVYAFDVALVEGRPEPISVREKIRASRAPTV